MIKGIDLIGDELVKAEDGAEFTQYAFQLSGGPGVVDLVWEIRKRYSHFEVFHKRLGDLGIQPETPFPRGVLFFKNKAFVRKGRAQKFLEYCQALLLGENSAYVCGKRLVQHFFEFPDQICLPTTPHSSRVPLKRPNSLPSHLRRKHSGEPIVFNREVSPRIDWIKLLPDAALLYLMAFVGGRDRQSLAHSHYRLQRLHGDVSRWQRSTFSLVNTLLDRFHRLSGMPVNDLLGAVNAKLSKRKPLRCRLVLVGASGAGKSALVKSLCRFAESTDSPGSSPSSSKPTLAVVDEVEPEEVDEVISRCTTAPGAMQQPLRVKVRPVPTIERIMESDESASPLHGINELSMSFGSSGGIEEDDGPEPELMEPDLMEPIDDEPSSAESESSPTPPLVRAWSTAENVKGLKLPMTVPIVTTSAEIQNEGIVSLRGARMCNAELALPKAHAPVVSQIWDVSGDSAHSFLIPLLAASADCIGIVFSLVDPASFDHAQRQAVLLRLQFAKKTSVPLMALIGTQADWMTLPGSDVVSGSIARDFAKRLGMLYVELSAVSRPQVLSLFGSIATGLQAREVLFHATGQQASPLSIARKRSMQPSSPLFHTLPKNNGPQLRSKFSMGRLYGEDAELMSLIDEHV